MTGLIHTLTTPTLDNNGSDMMVKLGQRLGRAESTVGTREMIITETLTITCTEIEKRILRAASKLKDTQLRRPREGVGVKIVPVVTAVVMVKWVVKEATVLKGLVVVIVNTHGTVQTV
ncbi:hypothetical protein ACOMHN_019704 [Nucella lapillus]